MVTALCLCHQRERRCCYKSLPFVTQNPPPPHSDPSCVGAMTRRGETQMVGQHSGLVDLRDPGRPRRRPGLFAQSAQSLTIHHCADEAAVPRSLAKSGGAWSHVQRSRRDHASPAGPTGQGPPPPPRRRQQYTQPHPHEGWHRLYRGRDSWEGCVSARGTPSMSRIRHAGICPMMGGQPTCTKYTVNLRF